MKKINPLIVFALLLFFVSCGDKKNDPEHYGDADEAVDDPDEAGDLDEPDETGDADEPVAVLWLKQWGSPANDFSSSITVSELSNVYVVGSTAGVFDENKKIGNTDVFIAKLDGSDGNLIWTKQTGTRAGDSASELVNDSAGNFYITGTTDGIFEGNANPGESDPYLLKFNSDGKEEWVRQWGTGSNDSGMSITADSEGGLYITGRTGGAFEGCENMNTEYGPVNDAFLARFDSDGEKQWLRQWGSYDHDYGWAAASDKQDNIYVAGWTEGDFDGNENANEECEFLKGGTCFDIFLTKFNSEGIKLWSRQWGSTRDDLCRAIATDADGNIYITGETNGDFDGNKNAVESCGSKSVTNCKDIFLTKFNGDGVKQWSKQWGGQINDYGTSVAVDSSGSVLVFGDTFCDEFTENMPDTFMCDIFLAKFNSDGEEQWRKWWATFSQETSSKVVTDDSGNIYLTGGAKEGFDSGESAGGYDIFVMKLSEK